MIKNLIVLCTLVISLSASAETIDLGDRGVLSLTVPKDWQFLYKPVPGKGYAVALRPETGTNAGASLSVIFVAGAQKPDVEKLRAELLRQCDEFVGTSVEKQADGVGPAKGRSVVERGFSCCGHLGIYVGALFQ